MTKKVMDIPCVVNLTVSSNVELDIKLSKFDNNLPEPKITPVRVESLVKLNHDVMRMTLKLPGSNRFRISCWAIFRIYYD
jgi:hypothetical protein